MFFQFYIVTSTVFFSLLLFLGIFSLSLSGSLVSRGTGSGF